MAQFTSISIDFETIESAYSNCNFCAREEISFARSFIYGNETNYWIESFEIFLRIFHSLRKEIRNNGQFIVRRTINRGDEKNDGSDIS